MPNNQVQAVNFLNGLLHTLRRKPQIQSDYLNFMEKIVEKGHASLTPEVGQISKEKSHQVWYLFHFGV